MNFFCSASTDINPGSQQTSCIADKHSDEIDLDDPKLKVKFKLGFEDVRGKLHKYIDPLNQLALGLANLKIMNIDEAMKLERLKPNTTLELVEKMKECLDKDSQNCQLILKELMENDQTHIVKFIVNSGKNIHSPDRVLMKEQNVIEQNMFCLKILMSRVTPFYNFLDRLVDKKCITSNHRDWIKGRGEELEEAYQLFQIMKRRSLKDFSKFINLLLTWGHKKIINVLKNGGVKEIEIHLEGVAKFDMKNIERGILEKFTGYVNTEAEKLNEEEKSFIDRFMTLLKEDDQGIMFLDSLCTNSISMYFQCDTISSQERFVNFCDNGDMKKELKTLYQELQPTLNDYSNYDIQVRITNSSEIHSIETTFINISGSQHNYILKYISFDGISFNRIGIDWVRYSVLAFIERLRTLQKPKLLYSCNNVSE